MTLPVNTEDATIGGFPAVTYDEVTPAVFDLDFRWDVSDADTFGLGIDPDTVAPGGCTYQMDLEFVNTIPADGGHPTGVPAAFDQSVGPIPGFLGLGVTYEMVRTSAAQAASGACFIRFTATAGNGCTKSVLAFLTLAGVGQHALPGGWVSTDEGDTWEPLTGDTGVVHFHGGGKCPKSKHALPVAIVAGGTGDSGALTDDELRATPVGVAVTNTVEVDLQDRAVALKTPDESPVDGSNPLPVYQAALLKAFWSKGTLESVTDDGDGHRADDFSIPAGFVAVRAKITATVIDTGEDGYTHGIVSWVHDATGDGGPLDGEVALADSETFEFDAPPGMGLGGFGFTARAGGADNTTENVILAYEVWAAPGHAAG